MLASDPFVLTSGKRQYPISHVADQNWNPTSILYLKIDFMVSSSGLSIYYHPNSGFYGVGGGVRNFTDSLLTNASMSPNPLPQPGSQPLDRPPFNSKSLAYSIEYDYYVVIEISRANWQFKFDGDAVTVDATSDDIYWDLYHLNDAGVYIPGDAITAGGSTGSSGDAKRRIAYFSAKALPKNAGHLHHMNLYVRLTQDDGSAMDLIIDPDVQNTGHN